MEKRETLIEIGIVVLVLIVVRIAVVAPHFEAKSFNDCTGGNATYFTALFTELRVQDCK